jgi:O-antigen/teichoic acid export membrane protein
VTAIAGVASLVTDCLDFGTAAIAARDLAAGRVDLAQLSGLLKSRLELVLLALLAALVLSAFLSDALVTCSLFLVYSCVQVTSVLLAGLLRARGDFAAATGWVLAERLLALTVVAVAVALGLRMTAYPLALLVGGFVSLCGMQSKLGLRPKRATRRASLVRYILASRSFGASGLLSDLQLLDTVLVAAVAGAPVAGYFTIAARVTGPIGVPATALSNVLFPRLAQKSGATEWRAAIAAIVTLSVAVGACMVLLVGSAASLVPLLFGRAYIAAVPCVQIYAVAMIFATANQPLAACLQAVGQHRRVALLISAVAVLSLALVTAGAAAAGGLGASLGFLVMQAVALGFMSSWAKASSRNAIP